MQPGMTPLSQQRTRAVPLFFSLCLALLLFSGQAHAGVLTFDLDYEFSGSGAGNLASGLKITLNDGGGTGTVTLTIDATGLPSGAKVENVFLNFQGNANVLSFSHTSGTAYDKVEKGLDAYKADGAKGLFDIKISYPTKKGSAFDAGETSVITITGTGITVASFNYATSNEGYRAASHIQDANGNKSGWYTENPNISVIPEPSSVVLCLVGLGGLGAYVRRSRRNRPSIS